MPVITQGGPIDFKFYEQYIAVSGQAEEQVEIDNAEIVFVGYGIQAPEYDWDDFKDVDLKGKVLLMMNNDPADDPDLFEGRKRLYYGRWDYKYESAARQGAIGAIIIHTTPSAGYPFQVVQTSWTGEQFELGGNTGPRLNMAGWLTEDAAKELVQQSGFDLDALRAQAEEREFQPVPLGAKMSIGMTCQIREQDTANVLGKLEGSDPELADEYVVYMAHHDHIGLAAERDINSDNIYNGAIDNASGSATMLAIAAAYARSETRPRRSILFAAVGAEEQGLLGSEYYSQHPTVPAGKMAAVINMDGISFLGETYDINVIGNGKSSLDAILESVATYQNRVVTPDHFPDRGYYYRSDQFSLAKVGVPGVYLHAGVNVIGKPSGWAEAKMDEWVDQTYHQPTDEYDPSWDLSGAVQDANLLMHVGWEVANREAMPAWNAGDEFEAARMAAIKNSQK
jgi:Zn-dependent M28 family amino/carboxypeptidase